MIAAVVVTYNRKELLSENISMLLKQTKAVDYIFIIDNCSTDGTYDFLCEKGWMGKKEFIYIKTVSNIGGAGGFYTGIKAAYEAGADWIILMDDDGRPANNYTVEKLYDVADKLYKKSELNKIIYVNALVQQGKRLSFKLGNLYTVRQAIEASENGIISGEANPFNGTMISKELVEKIGFPNKNFFIKGDEVDYKQRSKWAGATICTVVGARYLHPRPDTFERKVLGIKVPFFVETPWKEYYSARNFTYMYKKEKRYKAIAFEIFFVKFLAIISMRCPKRKTLNMLLKGIIDGWQGKLGATIKP